MRLLVVEDEHKIGQAIKRGLEQESYAVDLIHNGQDALGFVTTENYDVIILDRMLPNIGDGLNLCRAIRDAGKHAPIIMLTAKDQIGDRVEGLNAGADDYLVKPFAFEELLARIRALLRRPAEQLDPVLTVEDLTLNTLNYEVERASKRINLSQKEYALLEYLMRHSGKVLTKDMIMSHVWDYDADILPNTVEVYIGYLRHKVDKPFKGPPLIHTVRGFGYKFGS